MYQNNLDDEMAFIRSHDNVKSTEKMHATAVSEDPISTTRKRKVPRDSDASKKQVGLKRRRKDSGSLDSTNAVSLNRDEHLNGTALTHSEKHPVDTSSQRSSHLAIEKRDAYGISQMEEIRTEQIGDLTDGRINSNGASTKLSLRMNNIDGVAEATLSKASRVTHEKHDRKATRSISPLATVNDSSDIYRDDLALRELASNSDHESEDEAPEAVTAAAGLLQSRQAAAGVAKAEEMQALPHAVYLYSVANYGTRQKAATKSRRRERDARLKLQAKSAKKERVATDQVPAINIAVPEPASETTAGNSHEASKPAKWSIGDPLPELLPDEVLAAVPEAPSAPIPSVLQSRKDLVKNKLKLLHTMTKPPKRIKRGSAVIQFLEDDGGTLAPKVSKRSMSLRQSWLIGRCGPQGKELIPRRKVGGGFVRK